jgi:hypothetical protein
MNEPPGGRTLEKLRGMFAQLHSATPAPLAGNCAHLRMPWYKRLWFWLLHRNRLSADTLGTVEINLPDDTQ